MIVADLHVHSVYSDGVLRPEELVRQAAARGLQWLAITDHDTVAGYEEAFRAGQRFGVTVLAALEVSCYELGQELHVLGYGVQPDDIRLHQHAQQAQERRLRRMERMLRRCRHLGLHVTLEDVADCAPGQMLGRPHLAAALVRRGYCETVREAFARYLEAGRPAYEPPEEFPVVRALGLIHAAGGIAVIAHPHRTFRSPRLLLSLLRKGFDGMEVYHPAHGAVLQGYYATLARCHHLLATGGSDYHGTRPYDEANFGTVGLSAEGMSAIVGRLALRDVA
ncbi:MAG: PHP domain-containing protein [Candidatus Kapabacteria bacterium]|nr:PHP domain-containing protein [Candidatus Kapabacteria bacterium]MDW8012755.1 PHP domain-containing protein [Bacteroidota bacterium]